MKNIILAIMIIALTLACPALSMAASGAIEEVKGDVDIWLGGASGWVKVVGPMAVEKGDKIKTGEDGFAEISFANGTAVYLRPNTEFTVDDAVYKGKILANVQASLNSGELMSRVRKDGDGEKFRVKTPSAVAGVRGTEFFLKVYSAEKSQASGLSWMRDAYADGFITEILVETGEVLFGNLDLSVANLVSDGQWGIVHENGAVDLPVDVSEDVRDGWHEGFKAIAGDTQGSGSENQEDINLIDKTLGNIEGGEVGKDVEQSQKDMEKIENDSWQDIEDSRKDDFLYKKDDHGSST